MPGSSSLSTVPAGSAANALFVGAKTVNGPFPLSAPTSPAALTAATSVVWSAELTALSMMSLLGYIACMPTITVLSEAVRRACAASGAAASVAERPASESASVWMRRDMRRLLGVRDEFASFFRFVRNSPTLRHDGAYWISAALTRGASHPRARAAPAARQVRRARPPQHRLHLVAVARRAGREPLHAGVGDEVVVLDAHADVAVALHHGTDLRDHRAVARRVGEVLEHRRV